jgi:hypothetical protein
MGCLGRGTITLKSVHEEFPVLRVTLNNAAAVYEDLREVHSDPSPLLSIKVPDSRFLPLC